MEKLSKTARVLDQIIRVFRGLCTGFGVACAVLLVIAILLPERQYQLLVNTTDMAVTLGNVKLQLTQAPELAASLRLPVCITLGAALVYLGLSVRCLHLLHTILLPMAEARPFDGSVSVSLRKLGWLSLIAVVVGGVLNHLAVSAELGMYDLNQLFAAGLVKGVTVQYTYDAALLLLPAALFLLSYVFQYGQQLQALSDETL